MAVSTRGEGFGHDEAAVGVVDQQVDCLLCSLAPNSSMFAHMPVNTRPGAAEHACELCGRVRPLSFHHLIPRALHTKKWFRKRFTRIEMATRGVELCSDCHDFIHTTFSEKELGRHLNTAEALAGHPTVQRFVGWVSRRAAR